MQHIYFLYNYERGTICFNISPFPYSLTCQEAEHGHEGDRRPQLPAGDELDCTALKFEKRYSVEIKMPLRNMQYKVASTQFISLVNKC